MGKVNKTLSLDEDELAEARRLNKLVYDTDNISQYVSDAIKEKNHAERTALEKSETEEETTEETQET